MSENQKLFQQFREEMIPYRKGDLWGFSNMWGDEIIRPQYQEVSDQCLYEVIDDVVHFYGIVKQNNGYNMVDSINRIILENCEWICDDGLFDIPVISFLKNGKEGLFHEGKVTIEAQYDSLQNSENAVYISEQKNQFGLIQHDGIVLFKCEYDSIQYEVEEEIKQVKWTLAKDNQIVDIYRQAILEENEDIFGEVIDHLAIEIKHIPVNQCVELKETAGKFGAYLPYHNETIDALYDEIELIKPDYEGEKISYRKDQPFTLYFKVRIGLAWGIIDHEHNLIIPIEMDQIELKRDLILKRDNTFGVFIIETNTVILPKYDAELERCILITLDEGSDYIIFRVVVNGKKGFIGESGIEYFE